MGFIDWLVRLVRPFEPVSVGQFRTLKLPLAWPELEKGQILRLVKKSFFSIKAKCDD